MREHECIDEGIQRRSVFMGSSLRVDIFLFFVFLWVFFFFWSFGGFC